MLDLLAQGRVAPAKLAQPWQRGVYFSAHLFATTIMAALLRRPLVYLSWGVNHHRGIRRQLARLLLKQASVVLTNDSRTAAEVEALSGVRTRNVPYIVDTGFYLFTPGEPREDYLFCPGENDRDGEVLLALAERGHRVVWLNNVPALAAQFAGRSPRLELVAAVSFSELRNLYRRCRAVVSPMARDIHAAGQTTTLEALATGCTVVIGEGRTAELFARDKLVTVVEGKDPLAWESAIDQALASDRADPSARASRAAFVDSRHSLAAVTEVIKDVLTTIAKDRPSAR